MALVLVDANLRQQALCVSPAGLDLAQQLCVVDSLGQNQNHALELPQITGAKRIAET